MKILVVDDSRAMRMIITRTLRQAGLTEHAVVEADCGERALEAIGAGGFGLVLCDWNMPGMGGVAFLRALREQGDQVPFGFVTSESTPTMRAVATEAGASFLIAKPFTASDFQSALAPLAG